MYGYYHVDEWLCKLGKNCNIVFRWRIFHEVKILVYSRNLLFGKIFCMIEGM